MPSFIRPLTTKRLRDLVTNAPAAAGLTSVGVLCAFWLGGEGALVASALGLPVLVWLRRPAPPACVLPPPDPQTGLILRDAVLRELDARLASAAHTGLQTACLAVSIEGLDQLEPRHGRSARPEILRQIAARVQTVMRQDDVVARLPNGFAIVMAPVPRADLETLIQLGGRLLSALRAPVPLRKDSAHLQGCVGFCLPSSAPAPGAAALLEAAEQALSRARDAGPGSMRAFVPDLPAPPANLNLLQQDVALGLETGAFRAWFQPQISTETGHITGAEALARWNHPERGLLCPGAFMDVIYGAGLSCRLGEEIRFHAFSALTGWDRAGLNIPRVSVNLSPEELRDPDIPGRIAWELDRFELTPGRLGIEVLETVVTNTGDEVTPRTISDLARMGCMIDLDDFGTGNAAIPALRRFALHRLKIDRSLIANIDTDTHQRELVAAILSLTDRLGLETLAEGVETLAENAVLAGLGCNHVQGYALARPMPFDGFLAWATRYHEKLARSAHPNPLCGGKTT
ncbi:diguanylate cyclase/phosphodiesterase [Rhodovulum imhoffii]|uniref:Diguanylate cyclase/phosphodiesterase n=1 Tax=Rhodovulum imhoffii TaxID=365340 RepID=A0A2T5BNG9_9RHOB|nr:GGDEF domain-containing phosphodiesterase [Rhodovulum imhoffii]MBK5932541.1 hypothetical protein [Rhodovulum imhoffii]PTN00532.1 diguanylate cyclase/phosphodiesterase [Rhodovulum imhoffii]